MISMYAVLQKEKDLPEFYIEIHDDLCSIST